MSSTQSDFYAIFKFKILTLPSFYDIIHKSQVYAPVAELADAPDLGSGGKP